MPCQNWSFKISELLVCRKQLKDFFNTTLLHDTVLRILDTFMSLGSPHHWLGFLMPEHFKLYNSAATSSSSNTEPSPSSKFEQLMLEARTVLSRYFCLFFPLCCKTRFSLVYQVHHWIVIQDLRMVKALEEYLSRMWRKQLYEHWDFLDIMQKS